MRHIFFTFLQRQPCRTVVTVHSDSKTVCQIFLMVTTTKRSKKKKKTTVAATKLKVSEKTHRVTAETEIESMHVIDKTCSCSAYVGPSRV